MNTHHMKGPFIQMIKEENGKMYCHDMCDCGCIDNKWEINEGDEIIAFRPTLYGKLKFLKIHALEFKILRATTLEKCNLFARDFEKYPMNL